MRPDTRERFGGLLREAIEHQRRTATALRVVRHPNPKTRLEDRYAQGYLDGILDAAAVLKEGGIL